MKKLKRMMTIVSALFIMLMIVPGKAEVFAANEYTTIERVGKRQQAVTVDRTLQLEVKVRNGEENEKIVWELDRGGDQYLSVDQNGLVTGKASTNGSTYRISAKLDNGDETYFYLSVCTYPDSLKFDQDEYRLIVGDSAVHMNMQIQPYAAYNCPVSYRTEDASIAEVDSDGYITAKSAGTTTVIAEAENGVSAKADVIVYSGKYAHNIENTQNTYFLDVGESKDLEYNLLSSTGETDFSDEKITWEIVDDRGSFELDHGRVTGIQYGSASSDVKASITNGKSATFRVRVCPEVETIQFSDSAAYSYTQNSYIAPINLLTVQPASAKHRLNGNVDVVSDDPSVIRFDEMTGLEFLKPGKAVITVIPRDYPEMKVSHEFVCVQKPSPEQMNIYPGSAETLYIDYLAFHQPSVAYTPYNSDSATRWVSSDPDVLEINDAAEDFRDRFILKKAGKVKLTATSIRNPALSVEMDVTVSDQNPDPSSYSTLFYLKESGADESLPSNPMWDFTAFEQDPGAYELDPGKEYVFVVYTNSTNYIPTSHFFDKQFDASDVIEVKEKKSGNFAGSSLIYSYAYRISLKKSGIARINSGNNKLAFYSKDFEPATPVGIELSSSEISIASGTNMQLTAKVSPEDATQAVTWTSGDNNIATVDQNGNVKGINPGKTTITAKTANGLTADCEVRVLFSDVAVSTQYFYNPVYWALDNEITVGAGGPGKFSPAASCTREQFVTFLWRQQGKPSYEKGCDFTDVPTDAWYYEPISWAAENGITTGLNDGTGRFGVGQACTREQCVTFLHRAADTPEPEGSIEFTDSQEGRYYYKAIKWAAGKGITVGLNDGTGRFGVGQKCTRGMLVTFLYRYDQSK